MQYADINQIIADCAQILRPPRRLTVPQAAEKHVMLDTPGGYSGPWSNDLPYYMVEPASCLTDRNYQAVIFAGPAQSGKTQALVDNWAAHTITCDPADMMIVQTAKDTARDFSMRRVDRLIAASPDIKKQLKPGGSNDNTFDKVFRAGNILSIGWPTKNQLAGKAIGKMGLTDYDRMPDIIDNEADAFTLALNRTKTFLSRGMTMAESSPSKHLQDIKWKPSTPHEAPQTAGIFGLYNTGDRRRLYSQCPHCGEYFSPEASIDAFFVPDIPDFQEAAGLAELICVHCGAGIKQVNNEDRTFKKGGIWLKEGQKISSDGTISGQGLNSKRASFWMPGWFAGMQSWETIIYNYLLAKYKYDQTGEESTLQGIVNTDIGGQYIPIALKNVGIDADALQARAEDYPKFRVPVGVRYLLGKIDVQKNHFVVQITGYGVDGESWLIDRYKLTQSQRFNDQGDAEPLNPAGYLEDWEILIPKVIERHYQLDDNTERSMPVLDVLCDSGGNKDDYTNSTVTKNAYEFWRKLKSRDLHRNFHLVKGRTTGPSFEKTFPDSSNRKDRNSGARGDVPVLLLNTNVIKDVVAANMEREHAGAGYMHFPNWLSRHFYNELTAEVRTIKGWENKAKKRNEAFDLYSYGIVGCRLRKTEKIDWQNPPAFAKPWDDNPFIVDPRVSEEKPKVAKPKARRTRYQF